MKQPHWIHPPQHGLLDIQLSVPGIQSDMETPSLNAITKRDKRSEHYDSDKVVQSIHQAAKSIGVDDEALARSLASSVTLYLIQQTRMKGLSVAHVAEAIERVLVEMGYERIALAYVQYRDQHDKHQQLLQGDGAEDAPLRDWHWKRSPVTEEIEPEMVIKNECVRCEVPLSVRKALSDTVHQQLLSLSIQAPAQGLVVELTRQAIRDHATLDIEPDTINLEVDLKATERTLSTSCFSNTRQFTPLDTDRMLGQYTKEIYSLQSLFNEQVAEAHQKGSIHLNALHQVERLHTMSLYPDIVKSKGALTHSNAAASNPARKIHALIDDLVLSTRFIEGYCSHALVWKAINYILAPYLVEFDETALRDVSESLIQSLQTLRIEEECAIVKLGIAWDTPAELQGVEAIGPNGAYTAKTYESYTRTAQDFALVFMQVYAQYQNSINIPIPIVTLTREDELSATAYNELIHMVLSTPLPIELCSEHPSLLLPFQEETMQAKDIVSQCLTINMPKLVYAINEGGNFWTELERVIDLAASAFVEKHCFLKSLVARKQNGPYSFFSMNHNGVTLADINSAVYEISLCGLSECISMLQMNMPEQGDSTGVDWRTAILNHLAKRCVEWTHHSGLMLRLSSMHDEKVASRFATQDLTWKPELVKPILNPQQLGYSQSLLTPSDTFGALDVLTVSELNGFRGATIDVPKDNSQPVTHESICAFFRKHPEINLHFYSPLQ